MTLKERKEKRASLVTQMRALLDKADKENRELTSEEQQQYDQMESDLTKQEDIITRDERLTATQQALESQRDSNYRPDPEGTKDDPEKTVLSATPVKYKGVYAEAFYNRYARVGRNNLGPQFLNALEVGTDSEGGYLVPEEFETAIVTYLQTADPIRAYANVIRTAHDRNIPIETDRGDFAYIDEEGSYTEDDPAFGRVVLGAHKAGGIVKVSEELLQDAFFDVAGYLQNVAGRRFAALEESSFANGNGTGKPTGLFQTAAVAGDNVLGVVGGVSASAAITGDNIIDVFHKLGRPYRTNAVWVTSDTMVKMIRKLKDSNNQYLWQPGLLANQPDTLMGRPLVVSDGAPDPAVSGKSIIFGSLDRYLIVERLGIVMQRLDELYAANGQVGFRFRMRHDAKLTDANAIVTFTHGAAS